MTVYVYVAIYATLAIALNVALARFAGLWPTRRPSAPAETPELQPAPPITLPTHRARRCPECFEGMDTGNAHYCRTAMPVYRRRDQAA